IAFILDPRTKLLTDTIVFFIVNENAFAFIVQPVEARHILQMFQTRHQPIESASVTLRLRTKKTETAEPRDTTLAMAFILMEPD
ncbi:MAG: hypothetical protein V7713_16165, partial [Marinobacter sp.]